MTSNSHPIPDWAEKVAEQLGPGPHVVVTGISPSGNIHVGNLREVLVAEAVVNALKARGSEVRFVFHADTIDPLRKIAPGIPADFKRYIGHSLSRVPDPEGCHDSYAEHFLSPFEEALKRMEIDVEVLRSHELYEDGFYAEVTREALEHTDDLRNILQEISGRKMPEHWSPYLPQVTSGQLTGARILEHLPEENKVVFVDEDGWEEVADYSKGEGKLGWRVELAARWKALRATFEPFGKDHTSRGGSTDTADRMAREVFNYPVPGRYEYEWIQIKGKGAMSSSKGIVLLPGDMLEIMPPDALRRMVLGRDPARALDLDLGTGFPKFMDEYRASTEERPVPFSHLVTIAQTIVPSGIPSAEAFGTPEVSQVTSGDEQTSRPSSKPSAEAFGVPAVEMIRRSGYEEAAQDPEKLRQDLTYARNWAEEWAPESYRFGVRDEMPPEVAELDAEQRRYLVAVAEKLEDGMDGDATQNLLYSTAVELGLKPKAAFGAVYTVLLGKKSGPKAGPFVAGLDTGFVRERFRNVSEDTMPIRGES
ncbi:MAG: lysyl-tRNA synthetase, class [Rubrobacteraceae bacterium]|nr:lysyl-tRNA synthetase, class [Rubrobacteraceae bacterium]